MLFTIGSITSIKVRVVGVIRVSRQLVVLQEPRLETMTWNDVIDENRSTTVLAGFENIKTNEY
jgi:hypothetical protein